MSSEAEARRAADEAARQKIPIGAWLVENSLVSSQQVAMSASAEFGMPLLDIGALDPTQLPMKEGWVPVAEAVAKPAAN